MGSSLFQPRQSRSILVTTLAPLCLFALMVGGCVTYVPVDEFTMARSAYEAARDADAPRYAQALWFNAEQAYRDGQKAYKERRYNDARSYFEDAKEFAEQAENAARLARHQSGDIIP